MQEEILPIAEIRAISYVEIMENTAHKQLEEWLSAEGRKKGWLATSLHVSPSAVTAWLSGVSRPRKTARDALEKMTGIPASAWGGVKAKRDVICGVYKIDTPDGPYIGSSTNIFLRFSSHVSDLRSGKHANSRLQKAWDEYGIEAFSLSVVKRTDKSQLLKVEAKHASKAGTLNIAPVPGSQPLTKYITIRCTEKERRDWLAVAKHQNTTMADLARNALNKLARRHEKHLETEEGK